MTERCAVCGQPLPCETEQHLGEGFAAAWPEVADYWKRQALGAEVKAERVRAMLRWLLDEGHITPMGVRQIEKILDEKSGD